MLIRPFDESDLARLTEMTIETFRPVFEHVYPALLGDVIFANQWGNWRADYRHRESLACTTAQARQVRRGRWRSVDGAIVGYAGWRVDPDAKEAAWAARPAGAQVRRGRRGRRRASSATPAGASTLTPSTPASRCWPWIPATAVAASGAALCEHAFAQMRLGGGDGGDQDRRRRLRRPGLCTRALAALAVGSFVGDGLDYRWQLVIVGDRPEAVEGGVELHSLRLEGRCRGSGHRSCELVSRLGL